MANLDILRAALNAAIYQNYNNEISGSTLNTILNSMVDAIGGGYQFRGVATPETSPGTPDPNVFYIAAQVGTYSNFGLSVGENEVALFLWDGTWRKQNTGAASAEMVSQLGQKVDNLDDEINYNGVKEIEINFNSVPIVDGYVQASKTDLHETWWTLSGVLRKQSAKIDVSNYRGGYLSVTANANVNTGLTFTKKELPLDNDYAGETLVAGGYLCDNTKAGIVILAGETSSNIPIPNDALYVYINTNFNGTSYIPSSAIISVEIIGLKYTKADKTYVDEQDARLEIIAKGGFSVDYETTEKVNYAIPSVTTNTATGWWEKSGNVVKESAIISVSKYKGGKIKVKANSSHNAILTFTTKRFPEAKDAYSGQELIAAGYLCNTSVSAESVIAGEERTIDIPSNAEYLYVDTGYGFLTPTDITPSSTVIEKDENAKNLTDFVRDIIMPHKVYMLDGTKLQIFKSSISMQYNPDANMMDILKGIKATVGKNRDAYYEYDVDGSNSDFKANFGLYGDSIGYKYADVETEFIHVSKASSPNSNKNILLIGDSFTAGYNYPNELRRLLTGINQEQYADQSGTVQADSLTNITFIGTKGKEYHNDSCPCEGYGGEDYLFFATSGRGGKTNPFWNPNTNSVDFNYYCQQHSYSQIDIAVILLGTNGMHSVENITTVWNALKTHNPNIKVIIAGRCYACPYGPGGAVGMAQNQTWVNLSSPVDDYNQLLQSMCESDAYKDNFIYVDYHIQLDNRNNMNWETGYANNRNHEVSIRITNDNVHPNKYGYWQIADAIRPMIHKALNDMI